MYHYSRKGTISVTEPTFWRNYFYRVTLEKQAALSSTDIDPNDTSEVLQWIGLLMDSPSLMHFKRSPKTSCLIMQLVMMRKTIQSKRKNHNPNPPYKRINHQRRRKMRTRIQLLWTQSLTIATPPQNPKQQQQRQLNRKIMMAWKNGNASLGKQQENFKLDKRRVVSLYLGYR